MLPSIAYLPGLLLIGTGLYGLFRQMADLRAVRRNQAWTRAQVRPFIFSVMSRIGAVLLGLQLILDDLKSPLAAIDLGFFGALLILIALVNSAIVFLGRAGATIFKPRPRPGTGTWLGWVILSPVGYVVAAFLSLLISAGVAVAVSAIDPTWWRAIAARPPLVGLIVGLSFGFILGLVQWFVLRPYLPYARRWIVATAVGFSLAQAIERVLQPIPTGLSAIVLVGYRLLRGSVVALPQVLVLRSWSKRAVWWIPISALGHVAGHLLATWLVPGLPTTPGADIQVGEFFLPRLWSGLGQGVVTAFGLLSIAPPVPSPTETLTEKPARA